MIQRAERVLFVHAHPDDETIATGATIATLVRSGATVAVLTCTRGERGEVIPPELRHLSGAELAVRRETELRTALHALGVTDHRFLGLPGARWEAREPRQYRDSGMRWGRSGAEAIDTVDPESLTAAELGEVAADIAAAIVDFGPDVVVSYAADGGYGHPDHIRAHEATRAAAEVRRVAFYAVDSPGMPRGAVTVDPTAVLDLKRAALAAHRTQITVTAEQFALSSGAQRPIAALESFTRVRPDVLGFHDYALSTRIATMAIAALLGVLAGVTLTAAHQASVTLGPLTIPWGVLVAIAVSTAILVGLRLVFETRLVVGCAALGLLASAALLAARTSGGTVLVPANPAGYLWTFVPVVVAAVVLAWPRITKTPKRIRRGNIEVSASKGPDLL
ncbi:MAG: PIG-L family deacetylase [Rhodoglobus sp.]